MSKPSKQVSKQVTPIEAVKRLKSNINKIARDRGASDVGKQFSDCRKMLKIVETYIQAKSEEDKTGPGVNDSESIAIPDAQDRGERF